MESASTQPQEQIRDILYVRADSIGDNILSSCLLPWISQHFVDSKITVLCQDNIKELYEHCPYVNKVLGFNWDRVLSDENYRMEVCNMIRGAQADLLLNPIYSRDPVQDFLAGQSGARIKVAFVGDPGNQTPEIRQETSKAYTHLIPAPEGSFVELERHDQFLNALAIPHGPLQPALWLTKEDEDQADAIMQKILAPNQKAIALFPSAKWPVKDYPNFGAALVSANLGSEYKFISFGGPKDRDVAQTILNCVEGRGVNLCGETSFRLSAALVRRCALALGSDSALAHVACVVGTPNVVVLSGGHFGRFLPYSKLSSIVCLPLECYGCQLQCKHSRPYCVRDVSPALVARAINEALQTRSEKPRMYVHSKDLWKDKPGLPRWRDVREVIDPGRVQIIG
jgi:ADP-heptose:LPS heptosyltransferase